LIDLRKELESNPCPKYPTGANAHVWQTELHNFPEDMKFGIEIEVERQANARCAASVTLSPSVGNTVTRSSDRGYGGFLFFDSGSFVETRQEAVAGVA
jgi:hypothetical protein